MSPYSLNCSVCGDTFNRSSEWTKHLLGSYHQSKARLECAEWRDTRKECALVAFFSDSITSVLSKEVKTNGNCDLGETNLFLLEINRLLMTLESGEAFCGPVLITDFVLWTEQPKMCILQLESREKVNEVYAKLPRDENGVQKQHKIGRYLVQFKKLLDLLELEWRLLLPDSDHKGQKRSCTTTEEASPHRKKLRTINTAFEQDKASLPNNTPCNTDNSLLDMTTQYNAIIKSVQIPSHLQKQAVEITHKIKNVLCSTYYPKCEVHLLRSHHLKIQNRLYSDQNDILIFVHGGPHPTKSFKRLKIDILIKTLLKSNQIEGLTISAAKTISKEVDLETKVGHRFELARDNSSTSGFHLFTDLYFGVEAQLGKLLNYMCQFDLRCYPLISLMHYFCTANSCYFDDPQWQGDTMEWLVILFMSKKSYIPTVRDILNQKHDPIWQTSEKRKIDIGFNENDKEFLETWLNSRRNHKLEKSNEYFVQSVLKLFQQFLSFMGNMLTHGNLILNVRDGETLNRTLMFNRKPDDNPLKTKLTEEEINAITTNPCHLAKWGKWPFSIVHPLVVNLKLGFQVDNICKAVKLIKYEANKLNLFLDDVGKGIELKNGYLERLLIVDEFTKEKILQERLRWPGGR